MSRRVPANVEAEESLLGACLLSRAAVETAAAQITTTDFHATGHGAVWDALVAVWGRGEPVDSVTVADELRRTGNLERVGGAAALVRLQAACPSTSNVARYAALVADAATLRAGIHLAGEIAEACYDPGADAAEVVDRIRRMADELVAPMGAAPPGPDVEAFLAEDDGHVDWLVPGLLERVADRMILTGTPGEGKSTLLRQVAVQAAAGIVPFTLKTECPPVRCMIVDAENSPGQLRRRLRPLVDRCMDRLNPSNLVVLSREGGLRLASSRADRRWLEERVAANRPELVTVGSLYKVVGADLTESVPSTEVALFFDRLRTRYGFTLLVEAHRPHASGGVARTMRPYGATVWEQWPTLGFCIEPRWENGQVARWDLAEWRGAREERPGWPLTLARGAGQAWPWMHGVALSSGGRAA
ncbi:MAG TPA: DnaB-like helicase N-terminal domain-containing protein [Acidimicrobiales bacterium]|jgi:replicative DNA helicase